LISYEARQSGPISYTASKHDPPLEDSDWYVRAAKANVVATYDFRSALKTRSYNISILPAPGKAWYVYFMPAQTGNAVLPYGGDLRYTISSDGMKILDRRVMHEIVREERFTSDITMNLFTDPLSDRPEDSDVFYAMTAKSRNGTWIITPKFLYEATQQGELNYLGKTEDARKLLENGKWASIPASYKAMIIETAHRLFSHESNEPLVEAFVGSAGVQCEHGTPWFKISALIRNNSGQPVILHKVGMQTVQLRFAATKTDLQTEKYEKAVVMAVAEGNPMDDKYFVVVGPGMIYPWEREMPANTVGLDGKTALQILIFPWPLGQEKEIETQSKKWASQGHLLTDPIVSDIAVLIPQGESCGNEKK
jgi:hypothetical protein